MTIPYKKKTVTTDAPSKKQTNMLKSYMEKAAGPLMVSAAIYAISKYMERERNNVPINYDEGPIIVDKNGNPVSEDDLRRKGLI